jgi:K+-transporting ATPase KdpF subunit
MGSPPGLRKPDGEEAVTPPYLIVGLVASGLFVYLLLALLKPEWFG